LLGLQSGEEMSVIRIPGKVTLEGHQLAEAMLEDHQPDEVTSEGLQLDAGIQLQEGHPHQEA